MAATVNTAMFDARNGVSREYTPIFVAPTAPPGTHRRAAVVQAAYVRLRAFYPAQLDRFDNQRTLSLAEFNGDDPAKVRRGIDWGEKHSGRRGGGAALQRRGAQAAHDGRGMMTADLEGNDSRCGAQWSRSSGR